MFSYLIYNSILINSILFSYWAEYCNTNFSRNICRVIVFLGMFLPAAVRYEVGYDYDNYTNLYHWMTGYGYLEFGYAFLQNLAQALSLESQWIFVLSSFVMYFPVCFGIGRKDYSIIIPCYILCVYPESLSFIRQYMAVSFLICGVYYYLYSESTRKSALYSTASLLFHYSSALYLGFYALRNKIKLTRPATIWGIIAVFYLLIIKFNFINFLFSLVAVAFSRYAGYQNSSWNTDTEMGSGLGVLARLFIPFCVFIFYKHILKSNPKNHYLIVLNVAYVIINFMAVQIHIMGRLNSLFIFIQLFSFCELTKIENKYRKVILACLYIVTFMTYQKNILSVYPYQSIF